MLSNQILQDTIDGLKNITRREFCVMGKDGKVTASTEIEKINTQIDAAADFMASGAESQLIRGYQYFKVFDNGTAEYAVLTKGEDDEAYRLGKIAAFQMQSLILAYKERFDSDNFIKNLLLDNLLLIDIHSRAKKLHIDNDVRRIVYVIEAKNNEVRNVSEVVRGIFPAKHKDFVVIVGLDHIILAKELQTQEDIDNIGANAKIICEGVTGNVRVGIGIITENLEHLSRSYKEAKMALEVGKIFNVANPVMNYERLGIGRLIYQLPLSLCHLFANEVLGGHSADCLDEEALITADKFFDNNLNVSQTARQLYIHRNTLVYRLEKLQKMTGLDLRNFDDAVIFRIALMVSKYIKHKENQPH